MLGKRQAGQEEQVEEEVQEQSLELQHPGMETDRETESSHPERTTYRKREQFAT